MVLSAGLAPSLTVGAPTALSAERVQKSAVEWFDRMRTGQIDRTQLSADFNAQLTDATVETTSRFLQAHGYVEAKLVDTRTAGDETLYTVKLYFAHGNATNLQISVDDNGKFSDISLLNANGD
jgi:hypothetical protein